MAGDRGLTFVVVGLIGLSALMVSNHGYIEPSPAAKSAAAAPSAPSLTDQITGSQVTVTPSRTDYVFRRAEPQPDVIGKYPELSAPAGENLPRIKQRFHLAEDFPEQSEWAMVLQ